MPGRDDELIAPLRAHPERAGILCDFDGTLSSIVTDAGDARPVDGAVEVLRRLARRYGRVAVVSGRPASFLRAHIGAGGGDDHVVLSGLYGLESVGPDGSVVVVPGADRWRPVVEGVARAAEAELPSGVDVERKGLSVTLHVRPAPRHAAQVEAWATAAADRTGLAILAGRLSWELRPPVAADKGTAARALAEGLQAVCFLGDDLGDLPAFAALDGLRGEGVHTVKVAVSSAESPEALLELADLVVDGPSSAVAFLESLLPP